MLTQTDLDRERYESRRKAQLDEQTKLGAARLERHEAGRREEKIRAVQFCQRLLKCAETPTADLARLSMDDLTRLADDLQWQALEAQ